MIFNKKRTMKRYLKIAVLLMTVLIGVASCDKEELVGNWPKMEWEKPAGIIDMDGVYVVPASGGTYKFTCKNYNPWISDIIEASMDYVLNDSHNCEGSWFSVKCEGKDVTFTFKPRPADDYNHALYVLLTAGDIFDYFAFIQNPQLQE